MLSEVLSVLFLGIVPVDHAPAIPLTPPPSVASPSPLQGGQASVLRMGRRLSASGILIVDLESGQEVYGRDQEQHRSVGSLAKLMTALIILENHKLDEVVEVPEVATSLDGQHFLRAGEKYTLSDLLSAALISSANDAALTLAIAHSGSEEAFVVEMNKRAKSLGLTETSFDNPVGFDGSKQWSTPRDLSWLTGFVLRFPEIRTRMSTPDAVIHSLSGREVVLSHTHQLLHKDSAVIAGKTGTTAGAGECLVSVVKQGSREYLVVLLHSAARYRDMQVLLQALASPRA